VERGGVLSHGAIVARDFGIPAVVCQNATKLLKDGDRVRVDGNAGRIGVLAREAAHA
jgi:pyruvate,water dikinase